MSCLATLLLTLIAALSTADPPQAGFRAVTVCKKHPSNLLAPFVDFKPAQAFCCSKFPVPLATITSTFTPRTTSTIMGTTMITFPVTFTELTTETVPTSVFTVTIPAAMRRDALDRKQGSAGR